MMKKMKIIRIMIIIIICRNNKNKEVEEVNKESKKKNIIIIISIVIIITSNQFLQLRIITNLKTSIALTGLPILLDSILDQLFFLLQIFLIFSQTKKKRKISLILRIQFPLQLKYLQIRNSYFKININEISKNFNIIKNSLFLSFSLYLSPSQNSKLSKMYKTSINVLSMFCFLSSNSLQIY